MIRRRLGRGWVSLLPILLVVAIGRTGTLFSLGAATIVGALVVALVASAVPARVAARIAPAAALRAE